MLRKGLPGFLLHNDFIDLLPEGLLSYRFEYTNNRPLPAVVPEPIVPVVPLQLPLDEDAGNASDESESLLVLEILRARIRSILLLVLGPSISMKMICK